MSSTDVGLQNNKDDHVDEELFAFLTQTPPKSFFLKAGAGSGKTRSLVALLKKLEKERGQEYWVQASKVAVITYTKAASEEIRQRLGFHNLFVVATIHSFVWSVIKVYTSDVRCELRKLIESQIKELESAERKENRKTS